MKISITDMQGNPVSSAVGLRLRNLLSRVRTTGKLMQDAMLWTVRDHFLTIYPDSKHYSPDKVTPADVTNGETPTAAVNVDVPGVTRAYHNMDIRPKLRKYLAIPIHRQSYGKSPRSFNNLIFIEKKNGNKLLAQKTIGGLLFLYALKDKVFQKQDKRLMPSDEILANNIFARIMAYIRAKV